MRFWNRGATSTVSVVRRLETKHNNGFDRKEISIEKTGDRALLRRRTAHEHWAPGSSKIWFPEIGQ